MPVNHSESDYQKETVTRDGITVSFRSLRHVCYVQNPCSEVQKLSIFVPEAYFHGESINGWTRDTAPVFMPNTVGGYMPGWEEGPGTDFLKRTNTAFHALLKGYVVVSAGVRGRGMKDKEGKNIGIAPSDIVDLKAAIRFLRHYDHEIPGDKEMIITNGTSAGGAMSALLGSTGNHPDYEPYLSQIGAYEERDDVFASSCYCPITNLDHADMAYEWEFNGRNDYHRMNMIPPKEAENAPTFIPDNGVMSEEQIRWSSLLKEAFPDYFNSLNLKDEAGNPLSLNMDGTGSFVSFIEKHVLESVNHAISRNEITINDAVRTWLDMKDRKAESMDWDRFIDYRTRMKTAPAFDSVPAGSPETELFGSSDQQYRHFTAFACGEDKECKAIADPMQIRLMNPMNYIRDEKAVKAKHFRIRHGMIDRDTSLAISEMFYALLQNEGIDVNILHPWGIPHAGDYDMPELFEWMESICRNQ